MWLRSASRRPAPAGAAVDAEQKAVPPPAPYAGTAVGPTMRWRGLLIAAEEVRISGRFEGAIESSADVIVEPSGTVRGRISAANVRVAGKVIGDVAAARQIQIDPTGRVQGDLEAPSVGVAEGARVGGKIRSLEAAVAAGPRS